MITKKELRQLFEYRKDGNLIHKTKTTRRNIGDIAGCLYDKRIIITVQKINYKLYELIYIYHYDNINQYTKIFHKNGNQLDNRIENLIAIDMTPNRIIDKDFLHQLFYYIDGKLYWKISPDGNATKVGSRAGYNRIDGYRGCTIQSKTFQEHRIIYIYHYDIFDYNFDIDHINKIKDDNRIENLRLVTEQENLFNVNASGASFKKDSNKWQSYITITGKKIYLGYFDNKEEAHNTYLEAKKKYHIIPDRKPNAN